jgi:hypothetical protein
MPVLVFSRDHLEGVHPQKRSHLCDLCGRMFISQVFNFEIPIQAARLSSFSSFEDRRSRSHPNFGPLRWEGKASVGPLTIGPVKSVNGWFLSFPNPTKLCILICTYNLSGALTGEYELVFSSSSIP